jgi:hypothetical protein
MPARADTDDEWHCREREAAMMEPMETSERKSIKARCEPLPEYKAARPDKPTAKATAYHRPADASTKAPAAETTAYPLCIRCR